jgi:hypothetical protein
MKGKIMYCGEEWQLTSKSKKCKQMERLTDRIKIDPLWGKGVKSDTLLGERVKIRPLKIDSLKEYKDKGATQTRLTFLNKGCKNNIIIYRVISTIEAKRMFPTRVLSCIEYLKA